MHGKMQGLMAGGALILLSGVWETSFSKASKDAKSYSILC